MDYQLKQPGEEEEDNSNFKKGDEVLFNMERYSKNHHVDSAWRDKNVLYGKVVEMDGNKPKVHFDCEENGIEWRHPYAEDKVRNYYLTRLSCRDCGGRMLYNEKMGKRFCPFCNEE